MRITATQIESWGATRDAQALLPILVRRLIGASSKTTALAVPGGDSVVIPGWDGFADASEGNAWVPVGPSYWEFGCSAEIGDKATADLKKRSEQTSPERAAQSTFIFVSPRRWRQKSAWHARSLAKGFWRDLRVYDADDLEAWLEAAGSVAVWFGEQLGVVGNGIESLAARWSLWSRQTHSAILPESFLLGREAIQQSLLKALEARPQLVGVEADSSDEAAAFVAVTLETAGLGVAAACISSEEGWRFCDANAGISIGLAASPEVAARRTPRDGFTLIVPLSIADQRNQLAGSAALAARETKIVVERQRGEQFELAMHGLGEEQADAARLRYSTGRSWSVYRRLRAHNPAIRHPEWLKGPASRALSVITLVGAWSNEKAGDRACLEAIAGVPYETLEADLRYLARLNDPPVLKIGSVWKAKAPIDLLHLVAPEITQAQLDRFFTTAAAILAKPDPSLELEPDKRWAAGIYGKVRQESGLVLGALVDSLAKLSVYAETSNDTHRQNIQSGVVQLVRTLLRGADGERWLSLAGILRELAEAAPNEFLAEVEYSLRDPGQPVARLFHETKDSGGFGRCWYAHLLWAFEVIAWSPVRLARVCDCLAAFAGIAINGNWANTPRATLISFFRPWWPQTAADPAQRLAVLDRLITNANDVAWEVLYSLVPNRDGGFATTNAQPRWRDDDAGTRDGISRKDYAAMVSEISARLLAQAKGHSARVSRLVDALDRFNAGYREAIVNLVEDATWPSVSDREVIRTSVRNYVSWHNSYNQKGDRKSRAMVAKMRELFDFLAPDDPIARNAWLFEKNWINLPDGREEDHKEQAERLERLRKSALDDILATSSLGALPELASRCGNPWLVGFLAAKASVSIDELGAWLSEEFCRQGSKFHVPIISGALCGALPEQRRQLVSAARPLLGNDPEKVAAFLSSLPISKETLSILHDEGQDTQNAFWKSVQLGHIVDDGLDLGAVIERLLNAQRPRSAFQAVDLHLKVVPPELIVRMLEEVRAGLELDGALPRGWSIGEAIKIAQSSELVSRRRLALIEFGFYKALEYDAHGAPNLFAEILSDPSLFFELICLVYKRRNGPDEPIDEARKAVAETAWDILHNGRGVPGSNGKEPIDTLAFGSWISAVRELARDQDRVEVTDSVLGQWLSSCPADSDGRWPMSLVSDLLERDGSENIREGFSLGIHNNRGMTSRAPDEGGVQERLLVKRYQDLAINWRATHPRLAHEFDQVADYYARDAQRHDWDAELTIERL